MSKTLAVVGAARAPTALVPFPYKRAFVGRVVAPVPPLTTATVPVTLAALPVMLPVTYDPARVPVSVVADNVPVTATLLELVIPVVVTAPTAIAPLAARLTRVEFVFMLVAF